MAYSQGVKIPDNIVLVPLPPYSPELNPVELLWDWIRDHHFMNDALKNLDKVESRLLDAFHAIIKTPKKTYTSHICGTLLHGEWFRPSAP